jgi:response regulator NasT
MRYFTGIRVTDGRRSSPKIVIVDESPIRAAILEGLREAGFTGVSPHQRNAELAEPDLCARSRRHPDRPGSPSRDVLEQMFRSAAPCAGGAMFVDQSDAASIRPRSMPASPPIVDGLKKERIKPILDLCISRFNAFSSCRTAGAPNPRSRTAGDRPRQGI